MNEQDMPQPLPPPLPSEPPQIEEDTSVMSMTDWLKSLLLAMIPIAGLVFLIMWAVDNTGNVNRRNYARAYFIVVGVMYAVTIVITTAIYFVMFVMFIMLGVAMVSFPELSIWYL
ncbi:MAG: hypothetical protein FWC89_03200 [Defluviitaleaceae bacterium]|nr:hypothetical protein [Defluviitaleaceae bacterium]